MLCSEKVTLCEVHCGENMRKMWLLTVLLIACGDKSTDTSSSSVNPCEGSSAAHEVLYSGSGYFNEPIGTAGLTITDQAGWEDFVAGFGFSSESDSFARDTFDWSVEQVMVGSVFVGSTCGLTIDVAESCEVDETAVLHMLVEDSSGGCETVCDAEGQTVHIVAVPAGVTPDYSLHTINGCQ